MVGTLCPCSTGKLAKPWFGELARSFFSPKAGTWLLEKVFAKPVSDPLDAVELRDPFGASLDVGVRALCHS